MQSGLVSHKVPLWHLWSVERVHCKYMMGVTTEVGFINLPLMNSNPAWLKRIGSLVDGRLCGLVYGLCKTSFRGRSKSKTQIRIQQQGHILELCCEHSGNVTKVREYCFLMRNLIAEAKGEKEMTSMNHRINGKLAFVSAVQNYRTKKRIIIILLTNVSFQNLKWFSVGIC